MQSHLIIMVEHVIKTHAQKEYRASWENSIRTALRYILKLKDSKTNFELEIRDIWEEAVSYAATEVRGGCSEELVLALIDEELVILHCLTLLNL